MKNNNNVQFLCKDCENLPSISPRPTQNGDAISRQAVLNLMRGLTRWCIRSEDGKWKNVGLLYDDVMFGIDKLPSVTPQQRTGRWIDSHISESTLCECSVCGFACGAYSFNYCPNCGVKMGVSMKSGV